MVMDVQSKLADGGVDSPPKESLSHRVIRGGFWVFTLRIAAQLLGIMRLIILARLLAPGDFGLLGIALLTMAVLETFSQIGFRHALIQKKEDIESYLNSAWTVLILRGLILFIIFYSVSPYVAVFFKAPEAKPLIRVVGLSVLFRAFSNISVVYFRKELEFHKQFLYQFSGTLADFAVAVSAAFILRNAWALVLGMLAGDVTRCVMSYVIHPYRPGINLDSRKIKELWGFGKWMLGSSICVFVIIHGDDFFVGKVIGIAALGFYQVAYRISNMPATEISNVISQVTYPAYSKLQDDLVKLRAAYLRVLRLTAFLSFPVAGLIFALSGDFVQIFLGDRWMQMVPAMRVLVWWGIVVSLIAGVSPVFLAIGRPEVITKLQVIQAILLFVLIYPLTSRWGIVGTSWAVFSSALVMFFIRVGILIKTIQCRTWEFYRLILLPLALTVIGMSSVICLKLFVIRSEGVCYFLLFAGVFILSFVVLGYLADKFFNFGMQLAIKEIFKSIKVSK